MKVGRDSFKKKKKGLFFTSHDIFLLLGSYFVQVPKSKQRKHELKPTRVEPRQPREIPVQVT